MRRKYRRTLRRRTVRKSRAYFFRRHAILNITVGLSVAGEHFGGVAINGITNLDFMGQTISFYNTSEFTNLFDFYKLHSVDFYINPAFNVSDASTSTGYLPTMYWFYDNNDASTPTLAEIVQRMNVKSRRMDKPIHIRVYPSLQNEVYNTAISSAYTQLGRRWINSTNAAVPHYGLKYAIVGQPEDSMAFDVKVRWNFYCKNPK